MTINKKHGLTRRSGLIGVILIPLVTYWVMRMEVMSGNVGGGGSSYGGAHYTTCLSIFFNVVFVTMLLIAFSHIWKRLFSKPFLSREEIITIYIMLSISTGVAGTDMIQVLIPMLGHAFWFATPENEWESYFHPYLPNWLTVSDKSVLRGFYEGESTFYTIENLKTWIFPLLNWSILLMVLLLIMFCTNILIKKQWIDKERLTYPITQIPMSITGSVKANLFIDKMFWIGFAISGLIDIYNGIAYLLPSFPLFIIKYQLGGLFTAKPWNTIGWMVVAIFPFVVGLGYLIPVDLAFSCWFFFFFTKFQRMIASIIGIQGYSGFPFIREQSFGAYMGICFFAIYVSRKHFRNIFRGILGKNGDEKDENRLYRFAFGGIILGWLYIFAFCLIAGMSVWAIIGFFGIYFLLSLAITRMRAELGAPAHDLHMMDPSVVITTTLGTRQIRQNNLSMFSLFYSFNRAYRSHPMPHSLEGFKMSDQLGMSDGRMFLATIIGGFVGIISAIWILMDGFYRLGASVKISGYAVSAFGREPFTRLQNWIFYPIGTNFPAVSAMGFGLVFTIVLLILRSRLLWWNLHPLGYAFADDYSMQWLWASLMLSWLIKKNVLKYGGVKLYRQTIPLFIGLILGEFVIGSVWSLIGVILNIPTYAFKYW
ncbi:TPA: hypothetical protein ENS27_11205 [bacterium]|nr:hypothetical protein [bacterium]